MELQIKRPNSTEYNFQFEKEDLDCQRRVRASITLNHDTFVMTARTDCGDYSSVWLPTAKPDGFIRLMASLNRDYLLNRISDRIVFDLEESKKGTIENLKYYLDIDFEEAVEEIEGMNGYGEGGFRSQCSNICEKYGIDDSFYVIQIEKRYPDGAETFCDIFIKYLVPELKKELLAIENK